jgi:hypothetical protein
MKPGLNWAGPAAAAILVLGAAGSLWLNLPGHLSYDSIVQLAEGRNGVYGLAGHPPVMSWLLGLLDQAGPAPALFVLLDTVLITGALVALVLLGRRSPWPTAVIALIAVAIPQLLIYPAIVWKDVLFAGASTAGFTSLAYAARFWRFGPARLALLAASLALLSLAAMTRQNGAVVLPFAAIAVAWIAARAPAGWRSRGLQYGVAFAAMSLAIVSAGSIALTPRGAAPTDSVRGQLGNLQTYDIVRALALSPRLELRVLHARAPWFERLLRTDGLEHYSPVRIDGLQKVMEKAATHPDSAELIAAQWRDMFSRNPWLYLTVRSDAFRWVLLSPSPDACLLVYTGVSGPSEEMSDVGLAPRKTSDDDALAEYALSFAGTPVFSHAAYGALGCVLLFALMRRRLTTDIAVAAMLAAALTFAAAFLVISIACDYRYLYDLDIAVIAASLYSVATWRERAARIFAK